MRLEPGCPRCSSPVTDVGDRPGTAWSCATHGPITPLWRVIVPEYDAFADHLALSRPLPSWLPWPLPPEWTVSDFGYVATEGRDAEAAFVTCSGPSELDGVVELTVVTEEPGVGLAARCGGIARTDPGREAADGPPATKVRVEGQSVPLWPVTTCEDGGTLDRAVLAGEALGRWLWLVVRPASAVLLLPQLSPLQDMAALGPALVTVPFRQLPRTW